MSYLAFAGLGLVSGMLFVLCQAPYKIAIRIWITPLGMAFPPAIVTAVTGLVTLVFLDVFKIGQPLTWTTGVHLLVLLGVAVVSGIFLGRPLHKRLYGKYYEPKLQKQDHQ